MTPPAPATGWDDLDCPRCRGGGCEECDNTGRRMVKMPLSDVNDLDAVVHVLGIEDSDTTPAEAVKELHAEIERLRTTAPSAEAMRERRKGSSPIRVKPGQSLAEILAARTPKDYAIEFGEYLATASERFISATNRWHHAAAGWGTNLQDAQIENNEACRALKSAIGEFRKRALRARSATQPAGETGDG